MKMSEGIFNSYIDEYFFQIYRIWKWQLYLLNSFLILYIWNNLFICTILLTMEVSTTEIAQRKLTPGSLRSISWTLFFLIVLWILNCLTIGDTWKLSGVCLGFDGFLCSAASWVWGARGSRVLLANFLYSITAAQCVKLSLSNVSNWMGDRQRKHCAQLPGEEIGGTLVRDFALSSWGL